MKLTTSSEYALLALLYIARSKSKSCVPLSAIAKGEKLPFKYLEQLMHAMCRGGILVSSKGQHGGYSLALPANKISIARVVRLFDGPLAPVESVSVHFYKPTIIEKERKLTRLMQDIRDYVAGVLEKTTLKDLV